MLERSTWRRLMVAPVALVALLAAVGDPASASRGGKADDALARAVAVQINAAASVTAEAHGDQTTRSSGASLVVPGILEVRTAQSAAETHVRNNLRARAETQLGDVQLKSSARINGLTDWALTAAEDLSVSLTALRTECDLGRRTGTARTELVVHERTAALLGLDGELDGDGVLIDPGPNTRVDLGGGVSLVLNEQRRMNRAGRDAQIVVIGAVVRVRGIVVATLASSHCHLRGDVVVTGGGEDGRPVLGPEADIEGPASDVQVDAGAQARFETEARAGAQVRIETEARAGAHAFVAVREASRSRLASFRAGAYVRAASYF